uniref:Secreted protein n=1 Tax=Anguilla anguilla TaxID=7936 RepID=A0A0E9XIB9_ANGAN
MPFSLCRWTVMSGLMKLLASIGIPMPRFAYIPSSNSRAALRMIRSRTRSDSFLGLGASAWSFLPFASLSSSRIGCP